MKLITIILAFGFLTNLYGQTNSRLEKILQKDFPKNFGGDRSWVFYPENGNVKKIYKPAVKAIIPNYDFYTVVMTSYLGYHRDQGTCLVLVDSVKSNSLLVEPLWYGGTSERLLKLFIGHKFESKDSLLNL